MYHYVCVSQDNSFSVFVIDSVTELVCEPDEYNELVQQMREIGLIRDQKDGLFRVHHKSFSGKAFVQWVMHTKRLGEDQLHSWFLSCRIFACRSMFLKMGMLDRSINVSVVSNSLLSWLWREGFAEVYLLFLDIFFRPFFNIFYVPYGHNTKILVA